MSSQKSEYQKYEMVRMNRIDIKEAPYNPRKMSKAAKKKLRENLSRVGLIEPVILNKTTGNLVGGHQRISCLDALEGTDNYSLDVAVVELTELEEIEQNIFLNNPETQGEYDFEKLPPLLKSPGLKLENTGFQFLDVQMLFDSQGMTNLFSGPKTTKEEEKDIEKIKKIQEKRAGEKKAEQEHLDENDSEFYLVSVFQSRAEKQEFLQLIEEDAEERYIDGANLISFIKELLENGKT